MTEAGHVRDAIKEVDQSTWLIGKDILLRRFSNPSDRPDDGFAMWMDEKDKSCYTLTDAPSPRPAASPMPPVCPLFTKLDDAGDCLVSTAIGNSVILKVRRLTEDSVGITPEVVTMRYMHDQKAKLEAQGLKLNLNIPKIVYHTEGKDEEKERYFLFLARPPGEALTTLNHRLTEKQRQSVIRATTQAVTDMADHFTRNDNNSDGSARFCGVDGQNLSECFLTRERWSNKTPTPDEMEETCRKMGIECTDFVFGHLAIVPHHSYFRLDELDGGDDSPDVKEEGGRTNISITILDWEIVGYVPRNWVTTKLVILPELFDDEYLAEDNDPHWFKRSLVRSLKEKGYENQAEKWMMHRFFNPKARLYLYRCMGLIP